MRKNLPAAAAVILIVITAALLRFSGLTDKPLHSDEAVQGYKTGLLLESGEYRYDPSAHHGPTLYYLDLPIARLRGETTLAGLSEYSLRLLPALAGLATVVLVLRLGSHLGPANALLGAAFLALSPLQTYFSRHYIQEPLLALFALLALAAFLAYTRRPAAWPAAGFGLAAGLVHATKETSLILAFSLAAALLVEVLLDRTAARSALRNWIREHRPGRDALVALACGGLISFLFHSSFLRHPGGFIDAFAAYVQGAGKSIDPAHQKPTLYYLGLLVGKVEAGRIWSELLILLLAGAGWARTFVRDQRTTAAGRALRLVGTASVVQLVVYSLIPYKTPWLLLVPGVGLCLLAGAGAALLLRLAGPRPVPAMTAALLLALGLAHLGLQSRRVSGLFAADPRNPYAYVQTVPDILKAPGRIAGLAAVADHPLRIKVIGEEYWPLPWYLRKYSDIGYLMAVPDRPDADVILSTVGLDDGLEQALREDYHSEFIGLRPGVVLVLRTRLELWQDYVKTLE